MRKAIFGEKDVVTATQERISYIFDNYENIQLSFSGGKDSTVLFHIVNAEAKKRNRKFMLFFLDQEAEYQGTIDLMEWAMRQPNVIPMWYQVPIFMTNSCSTHQLFLNAWGENEEWIREKSDISIHEIQGDYPNRFYPFVKWVNLNLNKLNGKSVSIIGLRAEESPGRRFVMFGENNDLFWLRMIKNPNKAYPIIDWSYTDVWKFICENNLKYNKIYDKMYQIGMNLRQSRVSNLIHEKAYRCLHELQELEPVTYDRLEKRLNGVHCAAIYSKEEMIYSSKKLPKSFKSWQEYKDFLLNNIPAELSERFKKIWEKDNYSESAHDCKKMITKILLTDWENSLTVSLTQENKKKSEIFKKWQNIL